MNSRSAFILLCLALLGVAAIAQAHAQPVIPQPKWLVPASTLIVTADLVEEHSFIGSTEPLSARDSAEPHLDVLVQIAKVRVTSVILGNPPAEPIIVTIHRTSSEAEPGVGNGPMLLFLRPTDKRALTYGTIRCLDVTKGLVPWHSRTSEIRMSQIPLEEVVAELKQYIATHPPTAGPSAATQ